MLFGQYFPNPGIFPQGVESRPAPVVTALHAMLVEALGTFVLVLVIFLLIDRCNTAVHPAVVPPAIGATVAALIAVFAPQSQAGWNPARDLGPRIVAWAAGWGASALPGPGGGFWIYLVGPCVGSLLAGAVFFGALRISDDECENEKCK
nr:hypothetical protein HK105_000676 [Polyrhizophydium stewartii]